MQTPDHRYTPIFIAPCQSGFSKHQKNVDTHYDLPVTSCEAKRFLALHVELRLTFVPHALNQERLIGLALLNVHNSTEYIPSIHEFLLKNHQLMESKPT